MTNWKLGNREAPFAENDLCDRWGQQGFWMWKQCPYCNALGMRGKGVEKSGKDLIGSPINTDNTGRRATVYAVNVAVALVPLEGRKQHFPEHVEDWEFGMKHTQNDYTQWMATPTHGRDGHRVACCGCGNLSIIEEWDVEPDDLWIPEEGEVIGFVHSDATCDNYNKSWGCFIYEAVARKADGKLTWRRDKDHDLNEERSQYNDPTLMADRLVSNNIRVTNRRVMNVSPGSNLRHGAKVRERKELTAELLRSF
ncbi:MAG: hypothetical protein Unbinned1606contig1000_16 [Prokaryotic dsDNA virus sp.]|nr:MAG: hypothetical protein Unbinned1606contig1000_16 [Prokaryotic dsDNA virus sp.]